MKEIQAEAEAEANRTEILNQARQRVASELAQRLRELKISNSESGRQGVGFLVSLIFHSILDGLSSLLYFLPEPSLAMFFGG